MNRRGVFARQTMRLILLALVGGLLSVNAFAGRVPTKYNDRYQTLYADQELFRKRPELLGCVNDAKELAQASSSTVFNKLRFTPKSVQSAYVVDALRQGVAYQKVVIHAEGRLKAYSFFENWEPAVITCVQPLVGDPQVSFELSK